MSDASTKQSVECPICGEEFDPTVAGGWCTNTECGEWQYTDEPGAESEGDTAADEDDHDASEVFAAAADEADADDEAADELGADDVETAEDDGESEWGSEESAAAATEAEEAPEDVELLDEADAAPVEEAADEADAADDADDETAATVADDEADDDTVDDVEPVEAEETDDDIVDDDVEQVEAEETDDEADPAPEPATIDCPDCGAELDAEANFCAECGADVQDVTPGEDESLDACPGCGADVGEDDSFCVECGEDLDAHRGDEPDDEAAAEADPEDAIEALGGGDDPAEAPESLVLEVAGNRIPVADGDKVGREIRAALMDAGRPEEEAVRIHREHVRFVRESDTFYLVDLGDNPTALNGTRLTKGDREPVAPGDELELSGVATVSVLAP